MEILNEFNIHDLFRLLIRFDDEFMQWQEFLWRKQFDGPDFFLFLDANSTDL